MVDRINANRKVVACYSAGAASLQLGNVSTPTLACSSGTAQQNNVAVGDLTAWNSLLQGSGEVSGGSKIGAMIGAVGCVKQLDPVNNIYLVSVAWQGFVPTAAPGDTCGQGLYGNDAQRREVSVTLQIAKLS
jgi:type IV pilus assembly protein PilV